jgi:OmpA family
MRNASACAPTAPRCPDARRRWPATARLPCLGRALALGFLAAVLASCAAPEATAPERTASATPPGPTPPREALPLEEAVVALAEATLAGARTLPPRQEGGPWPLVIDPLIDRATGAETATTRSMVAQIEQLVRERHPEFELKPFTTASLDAKPLIFLGSITTVAGPGSIPTVARPTSTYRIWAVLGDLRTGMILSHPTAWVRGETVDATPARFYRESPTWMPDEMMAAYIRTCAGDPGTPMDPVYLRGLRAQAAIAEAIAAFEAGQAARALALYAQAEGEPGGQQVRALNGIYLANWTLGRRAEAEAAFGRLVDDGLTRERLAVKMLFRAGTTEFVRNPGVSGPYPMWLRQIATRAGQGNRCLRVVGHTSLTGSEDANLRLSLARAQAVQARLVRQDPDLRERTQVAGEGSRAPIIGIGTDDMRDALDRRVEFLPRSCSGTTASLGAPSAGGGG